MSYKEDLAPMFKNMSYQQQWLDMENSTWIWDNKEGVGKFGVTTWTINQAKAIQMHKARAKLSRIAKENGKPNNWVWFITVGGEETLSLAIPYKNNTERGEVQSFADFAAQYIGDHEAENFQQQFNEGILKKDYMIWLYRADLSPKGEENKKRLEQTNSVSPEG